MEDRSVSNRIFSQNKINDLNTHTHFCAAQERDCNPCSTEHQQLHRSKCWVTVTNTCAWRKSCTRRKSLENCVFWQRLSTFAHCVCFFCLYTSNGFYFHMGSTMPGVTANIYLWTMWLHWALSYIFSPVSFVKSPLCLYPKHLSLG